MKIYTRTGDDGSTGLFSGGRVPKTHLRVEAYGTVDELNAHLGVARAAGASPQGDTWLKTVQEQLFHLGADLATPPDAQSEWVVRVQPEQVEWLEGVIDEMTGALPELKQFVLPGGCRTAAQLHIARTVCRRAERLVVALMEDENVGQHVLPYLNRLSDWLFTLARWENLQAGIAEDRWSVRG